MSLNRGCVLTWHGEVCFVFGSCGGASGTQNQASQQIDLTSYGLPHDPMDGVSLTLAYTAGDLSHTVGKAENSLLDETSSSLVRCSEYRGQCERKTHLRNPNTKVTVTTHDSTGERLIEDVCHTRTNVGK